MKKNVAAEQTSSENLERVVCDDEIEGMINVVELARDYGMEVTQAELTKYNKVTSRKAGGANHE